MTDTEAQFLSELEALTRKYKICIAGCECVTLVELTENQLGQGYGYQYEAELRWDDPNSESNVTRRIMEIERVKMRELHNDSDLRLYNSWRERNDALR